MKYKVIFIIIVLLGMILRFYKLGEIPGAVNRDEAAFGYNAYSIIETGKDEFGRWYPMMFESFGDYKLPVYLYGSIPFIASMGLTNVSVRLLSTVSGVLLLSVIYSISIELFRKREIGLLAAGLMARSPWAVFYSRTGFETNVATLLVCSGIWFMLKGRTNSWWWFASFACFALSFFTYFTPYFVVPVLVMVFVLFYKAKIVRKTNRWIVIAVIGLGLMTGIIMLQTLFASNQNKGQITIFQDPDIYEDFLHYRTELNPAGSTGLQQVLNRVVDSKYVYYSSLFVKQIFYNFTPQFLVTYNSERIWNSVPGIGFFLSH